LDPRLIGNAVTKWIHLASAGVVVGSLIHLRFVVMPALAGMPEADRDAVWKAIFRKTLRWLSYAFALLILTGLDNIFKARRTLGGLSPEQVSAYWDVFWAKVVLVLAAFVIVHLLMVRVPAFRKIQESYRSWVGILVATTLVILFLSGYLTITRLSMLPVAK